MRRAENVDAKHVIAWDDATIRQKLFHIFDRKGVEDIEEPDYVTILRWVALGITMSVVVISTINIVVGSLPENEVLDTPNVFTSINLFCVSYFGSELLLRLLCSPKPIEFCLDFYNFLDFATVVPYFLEVGGVLSSGVANWIAILRTIRLMRAFLYFHNFDIVTQTINESSEVIVLMALVFFVGLPLGGTMMHYADRGDWNSTAQLWYRPCFPPATCITAPTPNQTAIDRFSFFMVTPTTHGYGDITPTTRAGKLTGGALMCIGVFFLAYPIMILSVNFEEERRKEEREKTLGKVQNGVRLRKLQKTHTSIMSNADDFARPLPVYFVPPDDSIPRPLVLIGDDECRYDPLLRVQRNRDGSLYMLQSVKQCLEVSLRLVFDTTPTQKAAVQTMQRFAVGFGEADRIVVDKARFFPVVRLFIKLDIPEPKCEFLENLHLIDHVVDIKDLDTMHLPITMELSGVTKQLDDRGKIDFHQALHRVRMHITALIADEDPVFYDVPILLGLLSATSLIRELTSKKSGVVYMTEGQLFELLNGVHHLIDLDSSEPTTIINVPEIQREIAKAILLRASAPCDDIASLKDDAFLYGRPAASAAEEVYHGIFVARLTKKVNSKTDDAEFVLTSVKVLAVRPRQLQVSLVL